MTLLEIDLSKLSEGLKTTITSNGVPLDKYQQSKLMIARGVVNQPCLLMIDGLLDFLSEEEFRQIIINLTAPGLPWRLLLVTHRTKWLPGNIKLHGESIT
jgi:ABC-type molybdenum transport system ATPase subunit/photorepair protein PhrA